MIRWALFLKILFLFALIIFGCTTPPQVEPPPSKSMSYPLGIAQTDKLIAVASTNADQRYSAGRLVTISKEKLVNALKIEKNPVKWEDIIVSNALIPTDAGPLHFSDNFLAFIARDSHQLIAIPRDGDSLQCNDPNNLVTSCDKSLLKTFKEGEPFDLFQVARDGEKEIFGITYLNGEKLDFVELNKTSRKISDIKTFKTFSWLLNKLPKKTLQNRQLMVKKAVVTNLDDKENATVYFLLELHKGREYKYPKTVILVFAKVKELLAKNFDQNKLTLLNLTETYGFHGANDLVVDSAKNEAVILAQGPEMLYYVSLANKTLIESLETCTGATSLSHQDELIVVPCFNSNKIITYKRSPLRISAVSKNIGKAPASCIIGNTPDEGIFCTYYLQGMMAIFDANLNFLGAAFEKASVE